MARKRLSAAAIEKLEDEILSIDDETPAVVGVCNMQREIIRKWLITKTGIEPTNVGASILIPERMEKLIFPKRKKFIFGGRGSAKTKTVVSILGEMTRVRKERIACFREIQDSIEDSSYQEIVDSFNDRNMIEWIDPIKSKIRVAKTDSSFTFSGLFRNVTKIKGKANNTKAWIEEAENVSRESWDIVIPTFRTDDSEIWCTFNPREKTDATWADYIEPFYEKMVDGIYEDDETLIIECNWSDNPWFPDVLRKEKDLMKSRDFDRYLWIWEGRFKKQSDEKVFNKKWTIKEFEPDPYEWDGPYFGSDFGFSQDPSTLVKCWIHDEQLWIEKEAGGVGVELNEMPQLYDSISGSRKHRIYGDSSRPETISHLRNAGFNIESCDKWAGSVEDGIAYLKSFKMINIHPDCKQTINECGLYSYKVDKNSGDILPIIVDKYNHYIDAIRYALNNMIKNAGGFKISQKAIDRINRRRVR